MNSGLQPIDRPNYVQRLYFCLWNVQSERRTASQIPIVAGSRWWMSPSQSVERSRTDRQDADCKSFQMSALSSEPWEINRQDVGGLWFPHSERRGSGKRQAGDLGFGPLDVLRRWVSVAITGRFYRVEESEETFPRIIQTGNLLVFET